MQNLEKAVKKNGIIMAILIIVLILLLLYTIIIAGDVSSAKSITEKGYAAELAELQETITGINDDTADYEEKIAGYQADIDQLNADIEAIKAGTYVAE